MRILITGSNGLLGQRLLATLPTDLHELAGIDLSESSLITGISHSYSPVDITDRRAIINFTKQLAPEVIIHTAAMTDVDGCELNKEICWKVNVAGTDNVAAAATRIGARLIFISTDYVFDGSRGPYRESDSPNPISHYGRSKLAAENILRSLTFDWTIMRTIVLYGVGIQLRASFITWLLGMLRAGKPVNIVSDQWGNTTLADDLAGAIERAVMLGAKGLFHVGGRGYMSRYEFAQHTADIFGLDANLISPITTADLRQPAKRPLRSGLNTEKAEHELFISFRDVDQSLRLYMDQEAEMKARNASNN